MCFNRIFYTSVKLTTALNACYLLDFVNIRYFTKVQKTRNKNPGIFNENYLSNPVSKFLGQPSLPTPGSLFLEY